MKANMSPTHSRSRIGTCLLLSIMLVGLVLVLVIGVPKIILNQAERTFGSASPHLNTPDRIYLSSMILLQSVKLTQPTNLNGADTSFTIDQGESVSSIANKLWLKGLIPDPTVFRNYLQYTGLDTSLKAGDFVLNPQLSPIEIAEAIQSSVSPNVTLSILAGWRLEEIAHSLPSTGLAITPDEFLATVQSQPEGYSFSSCLSGNSLEGFLFPGSYTLLRETTMNQLLPQILMNFEGQVTNELRNGFATQGLNLCQAVTLASIVQREAVLEEEMPLIASVFYNRLNSSMALESDPTVQYALGYNQKQGTWWTNPLSTSDLNVQNLYNTYLYTGLPPGPISNPGMPALQAVAFPAQTSYYYFRSACDGSGRHLFAETFEEHLANTCP